MLALWYVISPPLVILKLRFLSFFASLTCLMSLIPYILSDQALQTKRYHHQYCSCAYPYHTRHDELITPLLYNYLFR